MDKGRDETLRPLKLTPTKPAVEPKQPQLWRIQSLQGTSSTLLVMRTKVTPLQDWKAHVPGGSHIH